MKTTLLTLVTSATLLIASHAANTILIGTDPIEETGGPDSWDGIAVLTTPIAGPPGETVGIVSTFNFYADPARVDPVGLVTPLIIKESGGAYTVAAVGKQIEVTEGGIQSVPFEIAAGSEVIELGGGDHFHIGIAQERFEGTNNADGGVIPFAAAGGKGMFYFDTDPPHEPKVGDEVTAGHESPDGGRLYQFNFELEFSDDDPNALLPRKLDLGQIASFPQVQDFSIDVRNSGESNALVVESVTVTGGPQAANFSVSDFSTTVAPRGEGKIQMQIDSKGATGLFQATVEVKSNDESAEDQLIAFEVSASVLNLAGPASRLTLDEAAGTTNLVDVTGFNRHGVVNAFDGAATLGEPGLKPQTGTAMKVSGGGGAGISGSAFKESFSEFAVAMWVEPAVLPLQSFGTLVGMGQTNPLFGLLWSADGRLLWFGEVDGTADVIFGSENAPLKVDTVHHVVMTRSDERASIYVDGAEVASMDKPPAVGNTQDGTLYVGGFNGALGFDGVIDDVQIYDRALLVEDVAFLRDNPGLTLGETGKPADSDGDGLDDQREAELGTNPLVADTDDDGLLDGEEVDTHRTNPLSQDTDGDGYRDALEIAQGLDALDPNIPGGGPPVRAGDPNDPLIARASVDSWNSVMVIDEARPFDFASVGATSGVAGAFEFWVGAAVGRVTPFIAERTADNEFIVRAIGTTRIAGEDYSAAATAVSFPFDANNSAVEIQDGWVAGFTVADADGSNVEGAVIPFDAGGGDMWLAGGPAPEESASIALGEAPNTETTNTVFANSLGRLYAFAITAVAELEQQSVAVDPATITASAGSTYDFADPELFNVSNLLDGLTEEGNQDGHLGTHWIALEGTFTETVTFDLGGRYNLTSLKILNTSNTGWNDSETDSFTVATSVDSGGTYSAPSDAIALQDFSVGFQELPVTGVGVTHVRLVITNDNADDQGTNDVRVGLNEVQFFHSGSDGPVVTPEGGPVITTVVAGPDRFGLSFTGSAGKTYAIEYSIDLNTWTSIMSGLSGEISFEDTDAARLGLAAGYYRGVEN